MCTARKQHGVGLAPEGIGPGLVAPAAPPQHLLLGLAQNAVGCSAQEGGQGEERIQELGGLQVGPHPEEALAHLGCSQHLVGELIAVPARDLAARHGGEGLPVRAGDGLV